MVYFDIPVCRGWVAHGNIRPYTDDADINAGSRVGLHYFNGFNFLYKIFYIIIMFVNFKFLAKYFVLGHIYLLALLTA